MHASLGDPRNITVTNSRVGGGRGVAMERKRKVVKTQHPKEKKKENVRVENYRRDGMGNSFLLGVVCTLKSE